MMSNYSELFKFAAKSGSLEGYLFHRKELDPLENWISNILTMYERLPATVQKEIKADLLVVLNRVLEYGSETVPSGLKDKIQGLANKIKAGVS